MPAVLLELGFMDSQTDVPIILTEKFADQCAEAIVKVLVERGKLTKKVVKTEKKYYVQTFCGSKAGAEKNRTELKAAGFNAIIKEVKV